ncbi:MAG: DUF2997 domain-containing protein [Spirochaetes bacterium]|nr:DUF2997 domain-containing protein [Spirochaetota bacterium]
MAEHRIEITIDQDGKINAKTDGIKGEACLEKVLEIVGDWGDLESFDKTDEWHQTIDTGNTVSNNEAIRRG